MATIEKTEQLNLRVTKALRRACERAAKDAHMALTDWARAVLVRAANEGAFAPRRGGKRHGRKLPD